LNDLFRWVLLTAGWTAVFAVIALRRLPRFFMRLLVRGFAKRISEDPWNKLLYAGLANAGEDTIPMTSPDMVMMFGTYDISRQPVRIEFTVPDWDTYWSISLYAWNTDNFFVLNDRAAKTRGLDLVIVRPNQKHLSKSNPALVVAPTVRGIIVIRAVVKNREDPGEISRVEQLLTRTKIAPYVDGGG
jgi:uncharacterized membrane protein